jgi:hypothetical protein
LAYLTQSLLASDTDFNRRVGASCTEQAESFRNDARPDFVALANSVLRGEAEGTATFVRMTASAPGIADKAATDDPAVVDSSKVLDEDILSAVQGNWQVVAGLFYDSTGAPIAT